MHEQQRLRQQARIRVLVQELAEDPHVAAKVVNELVRVMHDMSDQRHFALIAAANASKEGLEFMTMLGESAKMVGKR